MSLQRGTMRGRPLATFAIFLGAWILLRFATWEPLIAPLSEAVRLPEAILAVERQTPDSGTPSQEFAQSPQQFAEHLAPIREGRAAAQIAIDTSWRDAPKDPGFAVPLQPPVPSADPSVAAGHQLLWAAAMAHLPTPQRLTGQPVSPTRLSARTDSAEAKRERWSLDAWAFWREGSSSGPGSAGRAPVYGASQAAAVLRYRLAPTNPRDPQAYVRAYKALVANGESELAAGLSARPLVKFPLRAHGELRAMRFAGESRLRPAAFVTTELDPLSLPAGLRAEAYGQAGFVGGEEETVFADGQLHVLRDVGGFDLGVLERGKVSLGGGAWGGAQKNSNRVDLGPSMRLDLSLGETPARISVDWRERVAGNAEPDSGVAVTLSTRF